MTVQDDQGPTVRESVLYSPEERKTRYQVLVAYSYFQERKKDGQWQVTQQGAITPAMVWEVQSELQEKILH